MAYFNSEQVDVFPCVGRLINTKRSARLVSEEMLTSLVNRLLDEDSFVIGVSDDSKSIEFNIHGYYFKLTKKDSETSITEELGKLSSGNELYACIDVVNSDEENKAFAQIKGQDSTSGDDSGTYTGLQLVSKTTDATKTGTLYSLLLLTKPTGSDTWVVPQDSYIRYTIDGGTID